MIKVYTCQKPQPKRCKFFLWDDDAQIREKHTLISNSRSELDTPKKSPSKSTRVGGLLTPGTGTSYGNRSTVRGAQTEARRRLDFSLQTPTKARKSSTLSSDEEAYSWDESLDNEVGNLLGGSSSSTTRPKQPTFTPNKAPRTATNTSPSKRKLDDVFNDDDDDKPPPYSESAPTTQSSSTTASLSFSPVEASATPTPRRYKDVLSAQGATSHNQPSDLASNILSILDRHDVGVPTTARDELVASLDQHHLKTQGIIRGRDISRMALKKKDEEIQALKARIERLETEREMDKVVISCLRDNNNK